MKNEKINSKIIALWNKYFQHDTEVCAPMFYDDFKQGGLLFVGMNPSFSEKGFKTILKGGVHEHIIPTEFFKWQNISANPDLISKCIEVEVCAFDEHPYFKSFREISVKVGMEWQHVDLFLYKETSQSVFKKLIKDGKGLNQFGLDQLALFEEIIDIINPQCVVVANAYGSELFREYYKDNIGWDASRGFHWFTRGGKKIPVFFSSMLSGQRALDRWSLERLVWHIRKAITNN